MTEYWIVACSSTEVPREDINSSLKKLEQNKLLKECNIFDVPLNIKYRSFDDLMRLVDELQKTDMTCENAIRRVERQGLEINPDMEFQIVWQRNTFSIDQFMKRFSWDDSKYPRTRQMQATTDVIASNVTKLEEEVRIKAANFNDLKQSKAAMNKAELGSYVTRNLADVIKPENVDSKDFIYSQHLVTVLAVVPVPEEDRWIKSYETLCDRVVPRSAKKLNVSPDKEGNALWRVVLFRENVEAYRVAARAKKVVIRDFEFCPVNYEKRIEEKSRIEAERTKQENLVTRICTAAFSEIFIAWIHLKAMRIFVESVLRYGVPPRFAAFSIKFNKGKEKKAISELETILGPKHKWGRNLQNSTPEEEEFLPFVNLSFVPLVTTHL
eukprot:GHVP01057558.1.p1 GENE.GHVP01057558.1~~GHVP01057558.1.p1  ORF type:complete len:382 (-),score=65.15 GHVP01057558.1:350-1495(-)